jgi:ectoine hydroxylase-related dioxygenase (phytanoyl-CoA dioxygenase family)
LETQAVSNFERDGFVVLRSVLLSQDWQPLRDRVRAVVERMRSVRGEVPVRDAYDKAFTRLMNVWQRDEVVRSRVMDSALAKIAAELLSVTGVRLSHDTVFCKPPRSPTTPVHADQWHWPVSNDNTITAWIPLQPVQRDNGPICYFAGSCHLPAERRTELCESTEVAEEYFREGPYVRQIHTYALGDISFHRGWTFHGALANESTESRYVLTIVDLLHIEWVILHDFRSAQACK